MSAKIITPKDLNEFKVDLLKDIKLIITNQTEPQTKKWLKSLDQ